MATRSKTLSKSSYIRSLQCLKSLYLYKNHYKEKDPLPIELLRRFKQGTQFGRLAWLLFPNGMDMSPKTAFPNAIVRAAQHVEACLLQNDNITLYEASFYSNSALTILDILVKKNNLLYAYEVKSSVEITPTYLNDAAFQYYVMTQAGFKPEKFYIVHMRAGANLDHIGTDDLCLSDVTANIIEKQDFVEAHIAMAFEAMTDEKLLFATKGEHCTKPYLCDFAGFCSRQENTEKTTL
ncbi:MAG: hypothetical protein J5606_07380 [Bacteroidales bacterium]|nr:hypothetical protein [Bacteroidales bacterium]